MKGPGLPPVAQGGGNPVSRSRLAVEVDGGRPPHRESASLFPLPLPLGFLSSRRESHGASRSAAQRQRRMQGHRERVALAVRALYGLASSRTGQPLPPGGVSEVQELSAAQRSALRRISLHVRAAGRPPAELDESEAFRALLKTTDVYLEKGRCGVRPYDPEKLRLLKGGVTPQLSLGIVPPHVRQVLERPDLYIERHGDEIAVEAHLEPYWDPRLDPRFARNRGRLLALLRQLADLGMVTGVRRKKSVVGLFFVAKKGDAIRMIVDGRQPNQYHRLPPHTMMGSVDAFAALRVEQCWRDRRPWGEAAPQVWGASVDLQDGFHQFLNPALAEWFVFDLAGVRAADLNLTSVYDCSTGASTPVEPDEVIWAAYAGMAMGWSWALWICHETLAGVVRPTLQDQDFWVLDKGLAGRFNGGGVGAAPYVDNANFVSDEAAELNARLQSTTDALDALHLKWHERVDGSLDIDMLGITLDGRKCTLRPKRDRLWRLWHGINGALRRRSLAGWQVRVLLGHLVSFMQLRRPLLSIFRDSYDFYAGTDLTTARPLPKGVRTELRSAQSLLFLVSVDMAIPLGRVAYASDASLLGYALLETDASAEELDEILLHRERSRFQVREKYVERDHDGFKGMMAGVDNEGALFDSELQLERHRGRAAPRPREEKETGVAPPPLPDSFVAADRWELVVAGAWRESRRIHELEARAEILGLSRSAHDVQQHGIELLSVADNMSCVCAFEKGRAVSRELLTVCRRSAALQAGTDIVWRQRHIEGVRNAADFMSRAADRGEIPPGQARRGPRGRPAKSSQVNVSSSPPRRRFVLELFSGCGVLSAAWADLGLRTALPVDIKNGVAFNLENQKIQKLILSWVATGSVWFVHLGTPCTAWSTARGGDRAVPQAGLNAAAFTVRLLALCRQVGCHWGLENPRSSRLWSWPPLRRFLDRSEALIVDTVFCAFGATYQKPTRLATSLGDLQLLARRCDCGKHRDVLRGLVRWSGGPWTWKTSLAGAYPPDFCKEYAAVLGRVAPKDAWRPCFELRTDPRWERQLAAAGRGEFLGLQVGVCAGPFVVPWQGAEELWPEKPAGSSARPRTSSSRRPGPRVPAPRCSDAADRRPLHQARGPARAVRQAGCELRAGAGRRHRGELFGEAVPGRGLEGDRQVHVVRPHMVARLVGSRLEFPPHQGDREGLGPPGAGVQPRAVSVGDGARPGRSAQFLGRRCRGGSGRDPDRVRLLPATFRVLAAQPSFRGAPAWPRPRGQVGDHRGAIRHHTLEDQHVRRHSHRSRAKDGTLRCTRNFGSLARPDSGGTAALAEPAGVERLPEAGSHEVGLDHRLHGASAASRRRQPRCLVQGIVPQADPKTRPLGSRVECKKVRNMECCCEPANNFPSKPSRSCSLGRKSSVPASPRDCARRSSPCERTAR